MFSTLFHMNSDSDKQEAKQDASSYSRERFDFDKCLTSYVCTDTFPQGSSGCSEEIAALKRSRKSEDNSQSPMMSRPVLPQ